MLLNLFHLEVCIWKARRYTKCLRCTNNFTVASDAHLQEHSPLPECVYIYGNSSTGKTHTLQTLVKTLRVSEYMCIYTFDLVSGCVFLTAVPWSISAALCFRQLSGVLLQQTAL